MNKEDQEAANAALLLDEKIEQRVMEIVSRRSDELVFIIYHALKNNHSSQTDIAETLMHAIKWHLERDHSRCVTSNHTRTPYI